MEATNEESRRAIDLLCARLEEKQDPQGALRGIAMLLCHGANVPRDQALCTLLQDNRYALLDEVSKYTEKLPELAANIVRRCHISGPPALDYLCGKFLVAITLVPFCSPKPCGFTVGSPGSKSPTAL
ncbi:hypothetical protein [Legionella tunisiensis]|uniref:hypothetical protein n=1 Tax=Legionella tunisiensis TaxID=1034944 RepID=UPI0012E99B41|nr:hypothetical protein [Legionella tunisiensis]